METLEEAYRMATNNDGAPGIDGVTFAAIEESGRERFLKQIQDELVQHTYQPMRVRKKEIPKDGGTKVRVLSIPTIRDRVVQGALKLILEPIFEADFQSGSYGYCSALSAAGEGGSTDTGRNGDETSQLDSEVDWEKRSPARRSDFPFTQQSLSQ